MNIKITNNCVQVMCVLINGAEHKLQPRQSQSIAIAKTATQKITIKSDSESYCDDGFYYLYVAADYCFYKSSEECELLINQAKVETNYGVFLLKPTLYSSQCECLAVSYSIPDKKAVEKLFSKRRLGQIFFTDIFEYSLGEFLIALLIGIAVFCFWGFKPGLIYTFFAYWVLVIWTYLTNQVLGFVFRKLFKSKSDKAELYKYLDNAFLSEYLAEQ